MSWKAIATVVLVLIVLEYGGASSLVIALVIKVGLFAYASVVLITAVMSVVWLAYGRARGAQQRKRELELEARRQEEAEHLRQEQRAQEAERSRRRAEQERQRERKLQREREGMAQSERGWWQVLGLTPTASRDEIVRTYRRKIQQCHPDRVSGLAPEFVRLAEEQTKLLNAAYAEAVRTCP